MNIALFSDTYPPFINGVSTSVYNLCQILKAHGHNVVVVCPRTDDGPFEIRDELILLPGIELKKIYGYRMTSIYSRKIIKILKKFKPDLIHNQCDFTVGQFAKIAAKNLKVPYLYTYHTAIEDYTYYLFKNGLLDRLAKRLSRVYSKVSGDQTAEFISPSYKTMEYMRHAGSDITINIVPTGIDFSLFEAKQNEEKVNKFKKEHNINKDTKVFLILGRIAKEKSMDISIKCFAKYHRTHLNQDVRLLIVGGGPALDELKELAKNLGVSKLVEFLGPKPATEVPFYYHLADIYTSASVTETQGLTFMESMASGNMVLAKFDDNLTGTIIDGETGFFFTDEETFVKKAEHILSMDESEKNRIRENIKETLEVYSIENFYQNIIGVYKRAIKKFW